MTPYQNSAGNSGVAAYQTGPDSISVQFINGDIYLYTYASAGERHIETMKMLAETGKGLSTFISQMVKDKYESKD